MKNQFLMFEGEYSIRKENDKLILFLNNNNLEYEINGLYNGALICKGISDLNNFNESIKNIEAKEENYISSIKQNLNEDIQISFKINNREFISDKFFIDYNHKEIILKNEDEFFKFNLSEGDIQKINSLKNKNLNRVIEESKLKNGFSIYDSEAENNKYIIINPYNDLNADILDRFQISNERYDEIFEARFNSLEKGKVTVTLDNGSEISSSNIFVEKQIQDDNENSNKDKFFIYIKDNSNHLIRTEYETVSEDFLKKENNRLYNEKENIEEKLSDLKLDLSSFTGEEKSIAENRIKSYENQIKTIDIELNKLENNRKEILFLNEKTKYEKDKVFTKNEFELEKVESDCLIIKNKDTSFRERVTDFTLSKDGEQHYLIVSNYNSHLSKISINNDQYENIFKEQGERIKQSSNNEDVYFSSNNFINFERLSSIRLEEGYRYSLVKYTEGEEVKKTIQGAFLNKDDEPVFIIKDEGKLSLIIADSFVDDKNQLISRDNVIEFMQYVNLENEIKLEEGKVNSNLKLKENENFINLHGENNFVFNENSKDYYHLSNVAINYENKTIEANLSSSNDKYGAFVVIENVSIIDPDNQVIKGTINDDTLYFTVKSLDMNKTFDEFKENFENSNFKSLNNTFSDVYFSKVVSEARFENGEIEYESKISMIGVDRYNQKVVIDLNDDARINLDSGIIVNGDKVFYMNNCIIDNKNIDYNRDKTVEDNFRFNLYLNDNDKVMVETFKTVEIIKIEDISFKGDDYSLTYKDKNNEEIKIDKVQLFDKENQVIYGEINGKYKYFQVSDKEQRKFEEFVSYYALKENNAFKYDFVENENENKYYLREKSDFAYSVVDIESKKIFDLDGNGYNISDKDLSSFKKFLHDKETLCVNANKEKIFSAEILKNENNEIVISYKKEELDRKIKLENVELFDKKENGFIFSGEVNGIKQFIILNDENTKEFVEKNNLKANYKNNYYLKEDKLIEETPKLQIYNSSFNDDSVRIKTSKLEYENVSINKQSSLNNWDLDIIGENVVIKGNIKNKDGNDISIKSVVENIEINDEKNKVFVIVKDKNNIDNKIELLVPSDKQSSILNSVGNDIPLLYNSLKNTADIYKAYNYNNINEDNMQKYRNFLDKNNVLFQLKGDRKNPYIIKDNEFVNLNDRTKRFSFDNIIKKNMIVNEVILEESDVESFAKNYLDSIHSHVTVSIDKNVVELKYENDKVLTYRGLNIDEEFNKEVIEKNNYENILDEPSKLKLIETFNEKIEGYNQLKINISELRESENNNLEVTKNDFIRIENLLSNIDKNLNELGRDLNVSEENKIKILQDIVNDYEKIEKYMMSIEEKNKQFNIIKEFDESKQDDISRIMSIENGNVSLFRDDLQALYLLRKDMVKEISNFDIMKDDKIQIVQPDLKEQIEQTKIVRENIDKKIDKYNNFNEAKDNIEEDVKFIKEIDKSYASKHEINKKIYNLENQANQNIAEVNSVISNNSHSVDKNIPYNLRNKEYMMELIKETGKDIETLKDNKDIELFKDVQVKCLYIEKFKEEFNDLDKSDYGKINNVLSSFNKLEIEIKDSSIEIEKNIQDSSKKAISVENSVEKVEEVKEKIKETVEEARIALEKEENNIKMAFGE